MQTYMLADQTNLYVSQMPSRSARYGWYDTIVTEIKALLVYCY